MYKLQLFYIYTLLITDLHQLHLFFFYSKFIDHPELLPEIFINDKLLTVNDDIHKYYTRIKSNIHLYQSSTSAGLRSVSHKAAVLRNELTPKRKTSSTAFKCNIKNIFGHCSETIYVFVLISYL